METAAPRADRDALGDAFRQPQRLETFAIPESQSDAVAEGIES
jgi:hypothetical protein